MKNASMIELCARVSDKLGDLDEYLNYTDADIEPCIEDARREMKIPSITQVDMDSEECLQLECRSAWRMLRKIRISTSKYFKYSTGVDGKSVDKTMVSRRIGEIMEEMEMEFKDYRQTRSTGSIWNITSRSKTRLGGDNS